MILTSRIRYGSLVKKMKKKPFKLHTKGWRCDRCQFVDDFIVEVAVA